MSVDRTPEELLIKSLTVSFVPLLDTGQENDNYFHLDLSINNEELQAIDISSSQSLGAYVNSKLAKNNAAVGYGGYAERRDIYSRSAYFNQNNPDTQRNIHLGIDLWCAAGTSVLAAYDGTVHSFKDNRNYGDYGPCVILKHDVKGFIFFTLYGHLSKETLKKLTIDQKVIAGEPIGHLGFPEENGDYPPHLHFQIILDLENYSGDYPGVSNTTNLSYFLNNCPDPNLLIKIY